MSPFRRGNLLIFHFLLEKFPNLELHQCATLECRLIPDILEPHINAENNQFISPLHKYYQHLGRYSILLLKNKSLQQPIDFNEIQARQSYILHTITDAYRYTRNDDLHADLRILSVLKELICRVVCYEKHLYKHTNLNALMHLKS